MTHRRLILLGCWILATALIPLTRLRAQGQTQVRIQLDHLVASPGGTLEAAVELQMPEGWHTYWANPSDSGLGGRPTTIQWELPAGISAGEIAWPTPTKTLEDDAAVYAYEGKVVLLVPLTVSSNAAVGLHNIKAKVEWLECKALCLPGSAEVEATLSVAATAIPAPTAAEFREFRSKLPRAQAFPIEARWVTGKEPSKRELRLRFPASEGTWDFYPLAVDGITFGESHQGRPGADNQVLVSKAAESDAGNWPDRISGLLVEMGTEGTPVTSYSFTTALDTGAIAPALQEPAAQATSFPVLLLFAFLGGLILNIMPCVLPVIALKILGFVRQAQESPARVRKLGLTYAAGVLASFGALAGLMIGLSLANRSVHQGVLFQSSTFLVGMTALVVLIALNLFGVFEVTLGSGTMQSADALARREGLPGAFFNGVLATALATPCSAPFLSLSLGFALQPGQSPYVTLIMYQVAGLGLALPYVILSFQPKWLGLLPKPGPWMIRFKTLMGFPMLGTAIWLFLLTANHYPKDSLLWLGLFMVLLALSAWIFGEFIQRASRGRGAAWGFAAAILLGGYFWMLESEVDWRHPPQATTAERGRRIPGKHKIPWEPWSNEAVAAARAEGRPIFVDFTADYCTTCQRNARAAIEVPAVIKRLKEINAVTLLADFSRANPEIAAELRRFRRSGVPLVLVYPANETEPPRVLPEFLTEGMVLEALEWASAPH